VAELANFTSDVLVPDAGWKAALGFPPGGRWLPDARPAWSRAGRFWWHCASGREGWL